MSKMTSEMAKEPFCTIEVETVEMAAYLMAVINSSPSRYCNGQGDLIVEAALGCIQGGKAGMESVRQKVGSAHIWNQLDAPLKRAGAHYAQHDAPWLKPIAPTEIDGNPVTPSKAGLKVGCVDVPLSDLKLLVEACEACDE